jgi:hypothetical protein
MQIWRGFESIFEQDNARIPKLGNSFKISASPCLEQKLDYSILFLIGGIDLR